SSAFLPFRVLGRLPPSGALSGQPFPLRWRRALVPRHHSPPSGAAPPDKKVKLRIGKARREREKRERAKARSGRGMGDTAAEPPFPSDFAPSFLRAFAFSSAFAGPFRIAGR